MVWGVQDSCEDVEMGELRGAVKRALESDDPEAVAAKARGQAAEKSVGPKPGSPAVVDGQAGALERTGGPAVSGGRGEELSDPTSSDHSLSVGGEAEGGG